jgi:hypothetical protein
MIMRLTELMGSTRRARDECGAILILALVFMVVTALLITGLTAWVGNDINNIGTLKSARTTLYAADGAIQVATANTRYVYPATTTPGFCPNTASQPSTDPFTIDGQGIKVWCAQTVNPTNCPITDCTRIQVLSAYPASQCTSTSCLGNPYVQSEVIFDDNTSSSTTSYDDCTATGARTTCGSTMTMYSYVVTGSSS